MVAGVIGAVVLPIISDKVGVRISFFVGSIILLIPAYLGFAFVQDFTQLVIIAAIAGFTIMGVAPILFQHGSEVAYPIQEGTSLGMILMMGQISGVLFVYLFNVLKNASHSVMLPMLLIVAVTILELPVVIKLKESGLNRNNV